MSVPLQLRGEIVTALGKPRNCVQGIDCEIGTLQVIGELEDLILTCWLARLTVAGRGQRRVWRKRVV